MQRPSQTIAGLCGLAGFAVALVSGMGAGNPSVWVLSWALASLVVCHVVGLVVGEVMQSLADAQVRRYEAENPVPVLPWVKGSTPAGIKQSSPGGVSTGA